MRRLCFALSWDRSIDCEWNGWKRFTCKCGNVHRNSDDVLGIKGKVLIAKKQNLVEGRYLHIYVLHEAANVDGTGHSARWYLKK